MTSRMMSPFRQGYKCTRTRAHSQIRSEINPPPHPRAHIKTHMDKLLHHACTCEGLCGDSLFQCTILWFLNPDEIKKQAGRKMFLLSFLLNFISADT